MATRYRAWGLVVVSESFETNVTAGAWAKSKHTRSTSATEELTKEYDGV